MAQTICIIEDDDGIQDVLKIILNRAGYETVIFSNGKSIMDSNFPTPDLFLVDKQVTGVDGIGICRYLKTNRETKEIPVIMMSAFSNTEELSIIAGADGFIEKPFHIENLLAIIRKHFQTPIASEIPA